MSNVAYIRVSTREQSLESQRDAFSKIRLDDTFEEKASGTDKARPVLRDCLRFVRKGDTLYVTRADRLARSPGHLHTIIEDLRARGVNVHFVEQPELSTDSPQGKLMLAVLAGVAAFETDLRKERCKEGIAAAQSRGVRFGRPALDQETKDKVRQLRADGVGVPAISKRLSIGRSTVYEVLSNGQ